MAATLYSISPSSNTAQNPRSQPCSPSNVPSPMVNSPDASFGCKLSPITKSSSSPAIGHLLFPDTPTYYASTIQKFRQWRGARAGRGCLGRFQVSGFRNYGFTRLPKRTVAASLYPDSSLLVVLEELQHQPVELFGALHVG